MAKYLYRSCPKCSEYVSIVVPHLRCGHKLELMLFDSLSHSITQKPR